MAKPTEISPEEAALILGVHSRTIRNLLKRQEIKGVKVNGRWYIDRASLKPIEEAESCGKATEMLSAAFPQLSAFARGPRKLAPYRLFCYATQHLQWSLNIPEETAHRLHQLKMSVLEHFGAGFYSYGPEKRCRYVAARSSLGAIIGLLEPYHSQPEVAKIISFLENECIHAAASLIRKIERGKEQKKVQRD